MEEVVDDIDRIGANDDSSTDFDCGPDPFGWLRATDDPSTDDAGIFEKGDDDVDDYEDDDDDWEPKEPPCTAVAACERKKHRDKPRGVRLRSLVDVFSVTINRRSTPDDNSPVRIHGAIKLISGGKGYYIFKRTQDDAQVFENPGDTLTLTLRGPISLSLLLLSRSLDMFVALKYNGKDIFRARGVLPFLTSYKDNDSGEVFGVDTDSLSVHSADNLLHRSLDCPVLRLVSSVDVVFGQIKWGVLARLRFDVSPKGSLCLYGTIKARSCNFDRGIVLFERREGEAVRVKSGDSIPLLQTAACVSYRSSLVIDVALFDLNNNNSFLGDALFFSARTKGLCEKLISNGVIKVKVRWVNSADPSVQVVDDIDGIGANDDSSSDFEEPASFDPDPDPDPFGWFTSTDDPSTDDASIFVKGVDDVDYDDYDWEPKECCTDVYVCERNHRDKPNGVHLRSVVDVFSVTIIRSTNDNSPVRIHGAIRVINGGRGYYIFHRTREEGQVLETPGDKLTLSLGGPISLSPFLDCCDTTMIVALKYNNEDIFAAGHDPDCPIYHDDAAHEDFGFDAITLSLPYFQNFEGFANRSSSLPELNLVSSVDVELGVIKWGVLARLRFDVSRDLCLYGTIKARSCNFDRGIVVFERRVDEAVEVKSGDSIPLLKTAACVSYCSTLVIDVALFDRKDNNLTLRDAVFFPARPKGLREKFVSNGVIKVKVRWVNSQEVPW